MFRPQFPYPLPPAPCQDQKTQYSFDSTSLPALSGNLAAGAQTGRIPLGIDADAVFYLRGIKSQGALSFRLEDPNGNGLSDSDNTTQRTNFEVPAEYGNTGGAGIVALETGADGLFVPAGGNVILYLFNGTSGAIALSTVAINLHGVKRYPDSGCNG
jgi:hypothetical protein